jgi:hypothetical protein
MEKRYSLITSRIIETSNDIDVIERKAKIMLKNKQEATIQCNGVEIGFVGKDLTQRTGWGMYIKK